jgi:hypothetical protein
VLRRTGHHEVASDTGEEHCALMATLIGSARLSGVEPLARLTDVLQRIVAGRTKSDEIGSLMPWNWKTQAALPAAV